MQKVKIYCGNELLRVVETNIIPREGETIWLDATVDNSDMRKVESVLYTVIGRQLEVTLMVSK